MEFQLLLEETGWYLMSNCSSDQFRISLHASCMTLTSLTSLTHFRKRGKGLINGVCKPCPNGMQLAGWHNQISNNAFLNYLLRSKHAPWKLFLECFQSFWSSGKDVLAFLCCFQDCYCYSNNDVMYQLLKYCNMIGLHCTVRRDKACIRSSLDPSLSQKWVWFARLDVDIAFCSVIYIYINAAVINRTHKSNVHADWCHNIQVVIHYVIITNMHTFALNYSGKRKVWVRVHGHFISSGILSPQVLPVSFFSPLSVTVALCAMVCASVVLSGDII